MQQKRKYKANRQVKEITKEQRKRIKGENKERKRTKGWPSMLSNKRGCPRRTTVDLDLLSVVPLYWNMDDTCAIK